MNTINGLFRKLDLFGVSYTFKYNSREKYTTTLGGIITFIFLVIALFVAIYNFIPFYTKKNFTTIYYILKLAETEKIYFDKSKMTFSIGLNCWEGYDGTKAEDLFDVQYKYIYWDVQDGEYVRKTEELGIHPCTHSDFYNEFDKSFDDSKVYTYQCLDDLSRPIEGIYSSPVFSYYEFNVNAKNKSKTLFDKIESYLIENDCKLQIYYIDKTVDIDDYGSPIKGYLETDFIQINPTLSTRRNMYFMNQHLYDEDTFLSLLHDQKNEDSKLSSLYSRYEEYSLYQGLNRTNSSSDYLNWVKLFFRADTRKTYVKRNYQGIMEFYADASSLLIGIYQLLIIIFNFINNFYAELSLSKKIFFFKELKDSNLDISKHSKKISELLAQTSSKSNFSTIDTQFDDKKVNINPSSFANSQNTVTINKNKKRNVQKKPKGKIDVLTKKFEIKTDYVEQSIDKLKTHRLQTDTVSVKKGKIQVNNQNDKIESAPNKTDEISSIDKFDDIKYDFNMCEIIISSFCKCCLMRNLGIKNNINEKAKSLLNNSLDVVCFVRNHMLFNIINETILDENIKSVVNFLCRPIISIENDYNKNENIQFYQCFKDEDFEKFSDELIRLDKKPKKEIKENKLIFLSNNHLKNFSNNNIS